MLEKLRDIWGDPWIIVEQVRSSVGVVDDLRIIDALAVCLEKGDGYRMIYFEQKVSAKDFGVELRSPEKSRLTAHCEESYLVVPAPRRNVINDLNRLPRGWGLIEIGTGKPVTIVEATKRENVVAPSTDFVKAILRAAFSRGGSAAADVGAPMVTITKPGLSRVHVGLACGHTAPTPLDKKMPAKIPCFSCADGRKADAEVVEAAIEDAEDADLDRIAKVLNRQRMIRGLDETG